MKPRTSPARRALALLAWSLAYVVVAPLAWCAARRRRARLAWTVTALAVAVAALALAPPRGRAPRAPSPHARTDRGTGARVATFNIRTFGATQTDDARLLELLASLDADVVAVQEIQDRERFQGLVARLAAPGRRYATTLSECGGKRDMRVGFVYDAARVELRGRREYPELDPDAEGRCVEGDRPGLLGEFAVGARRFDLLVVHFTSGGAEEKYARRRVQWRRALEIVARRREQGVREVAVLGDANSAGYLDNRWGEREEIDRLLAGADMVMLTSALRCTAYWRASARTLEPSLLDHVAATREFAGGAASVRGYCVEAGCRALSAADPPRDYATVSDHCPVTIGP